MFSVITPTFNRQDKVCRSIESSINLYHSGEVSEIIVIDDASEDNSVEKIKSKFGEFIKKDIIILIENEINIGVTASRNKGIKIAKSQYVIMLDSDDYFVDLKNIKLTEYVSEYREYGLIYFRSQSIRNNLLVGKESEPHEIFLKEITHFGEIYGEMTPIIKTHLARKYPYNEFLRGCESVMYDAIIYYGHRAFLSKHILRVYDDTGSDRISLKNTSYFIRSSELFHFYLIRSKYFHKLSLKIQLKIIIAIPFYGLMSLIKLISTKFNKSSSNDT